MFKTDHLIITNNTSPHKLPQCKNNVVYDFSCQPTLGDCTSNINNQKTLLNTYMVHAHTLHYTTLSHRLTLHRES